MVLWEITLGTAYFLGLKRTYRLALKIQRRVISEKHPRVRQFAHRRTRAIFDMALRVHRSIQERDIEVGRNVGNWVLRWLDKMKPSAQIRPHSGGNINANKSMNKQLTDSSHQKTTGDVRTFTGKTRDRESDRLLFSSSRNMLPKPFPTTTMMIRPPKPSGNNIQQRHFCTSGHQGRLGNEGVIQKHIMRWMLRN